MSNKKQSIVMVLHRDENGSGFIPDQYNALLNIENFLLIYDIIQIKDKFHNIYYKVQY